MKRLANLDELSVTIDEPDGAEARGTVWPVALPLRASQALPVPLEGLDRGLVATHWLPGAMSQDLLNG